MSPVRSTARVYTGVVGLPITLTFRDQDNTLINVSSGQGSVVVKIRRPKGQTILTYSGASVDVSNGATGIVVITTASGELDKPGVHEVQGFFTRTSPAGVFPSDKLLITVEPSVA